MAKSTSQKFSHGDSRTQSQHSKSQGGTDKLPQKKSKKPMKSNITNKVKSRHSGNPPASSEDESDGDEGDGGTIDEQPDSAEEPDVFALSSARQHEFDAARRLAGLEGEDDDMFQDMEINDATQAVAGDEFKIDGSEDNDYVDVDDVSDSDASDGENDELHVLQSAERDLIDEFERTEQRRNANTVTNDMSEMAIHEEEALARRLSLQANDSQVDEFGFEINMNEDPFFGLAKNDNLYADMWNEAESALWRMPETVRTREQSDPSSTTQKRVRFFEPDSRESSSSGTEDPNESYPDLFAASDDPLVKQRIALNLEQDIAVNGKDFADADSFYDFADEDEKLAFQLDEQSDSEDDMSSYDSDDGDTTDEETREEQVARMQDRKRAAGRTAESTPGTPLPAKRTVSNAARTPSAPRPMTPNDCKGPKTGTFAIDPTRATMTTDAEGRKIKLLPPSKPLEKDREFWERARTANSSRNGSPPNSSYLTIPSPGADNFPARPFTAQSTLGSMFNGNLDILRNNDVAGIADNLFPAMMDGPHPSFTAATTTTEDSDNDQLDINMQEFIDMDGSGSDSDGPPSAPMTSPMGPDMFNSFTSDSGANDCQGSGSLNYFDQYRGVVGSFRRNQEQAKHYSSLASHPAKRASAHEYNALQKGRRGAANTPMTPARKKRASQDITPSAAGIRKSVNSPLTTRRPRSRGNSLAGISGVDLYQTLTRSPFE